MKVAIDSSPLEMGHKIRGVGNYTRNLILELKKIGSKNKNLTIAPINFYNTSQDLSSYNIIHYPYFDLFFRSLPFIKPTKTIVTIHDVIPLRYPQHYPPGLKGKIKFFIQRSLLKNIDAIITDSLASKRDIVKFLNYPEGKIFPIYLGIEKHFRKITNKAILENARNKYRLPKKFVLYVGDVNYNKNLLSLAEACKKIKTHLVIVGKQATIEKFDMNHPETQSWSEFLEKYRNDLDIQRLGFVPTKDLVAIYNVASAYCQPSFYEGFGFPILEAMGCGCPVVATNSSSLKEIGKDSVLFVKPNAEDLSKGLSKILGSLSLRKQLIRRG